MSKKPQKIKHPRTTAEGEVIVFLCGGSLKAPIHYQTMSYGSDLSRTLHTFTSLTAITPALFLADTGVTVANKNCTSH